MPGVSGTQAGNREQVEGVDTKYIANNVESEVITINIYINDPELIKKLKEEAKKSNRSLSYIVREKLNKAYGKIGDGKNGEAKWQS